MIGIIKRWNEDRGFGFVRLPNGKEFFCHISHWMEEIEPPTDGKSVTFDLIPGRDNIRQQAGNVRFAPVVEPKPVAEPAVAGLDALNKVGE